MEVHEDSPGGRTCGIQCPPACARSRSASSTGDRGGGGGGMPLPSSRHTHETRQRSRQPQWASTMTMSSAGKSSRPSGSWTDGTARCWLIECRPRAVKASSGPNWAAAARTADTAARSCDTARCAGCAGVPPTMGPASDDATWPNANGRHGARSPRMHGLSLLTSPQCRRPPLLPIASRPYSGQAGRLASN
eukprot:scaffold42404_cov101-Isochrysis_galbana.AAC.2